MNALFKLLCIIFYLQYFTYIYDSEYIHIDKFYLQYTIQFSTLVFSVFCFFS